MTTSEMKPNRAGNETGWVKMTGARERPRATTLPTRSHMNMNTKRFFLSVVLLFLVTVPIQADELSDYLAEAALNNSGLEAAFNRWQAELEEVPQVQTLPNPRISYTYYVQEVETRVGPQRQKFGLAQTVPWFGKRALRSEAASEAAAAARQAFEQAKLELFYRVQSAYFEYYILGRSIDLTRQHLILLRQIEQVARTRFQAGSAPQIDLIQAQVELGKLEDRFQTLEALRGPVAAKLNAALNSPMDVERPLPARIAPRPVSFSDEQIMQRLQTNNPSLKQLDAQIRKEQAAEKLAHRNRYPDVTFGVDYIQTDPARMSTPDSGKDAVMAMVSIQLPIWFGELKAAEKEAAYRRTATESERTNRENLLDSSLQLTLYHFHDAGRKIDLYRDTLIPQAEQAMKVALQGFRDGGVSFISLIDAERRLLEFQLAADQALADRETRLAEMEWLTGEIQ